MSRKLYVSRSPLASARRMGEETLVMFAPSSTLFTLDETASLIWEAADGITPLDQVVANRICSDFDVERETALLDAEKVVQELAKHGVLMISDQPIPQGSGLPADD